MADTTNLNLYYDFVRKYARKHKLTFLCAQTVIKNKRKWAKYKKKNKIKPILGPRKKYMPKEPPKTHAKLINEILESVDLPNLYIA